MTQDVVPDEAIPAEVIPEDAVPWEFTSILEAIQRRRVLICEWR